MEMDTHVCLKTFDPKHPQIYVPIKGDSIFAEELVSKIGDFFGLKQASLKYFGIFEGFTFPTRKFSCVDKVSATAEGLTFQKWCFDLKHEDILMKDAVAMRLLYGQARAAIQDGKLTPTTEQLTKLEEHADPSFEVHAPYVKECQKMPGYISVTIRNCVLFHDFSLHSIQFPEGTELVISAAKRGMQLLVNNNEYFISWRKVRSWTRAEDDLYVTMKIYSVTSDTYADLCVKSDQANYLVAVVMEMIKIMQAELKGPMFQTSDLKRNKRRQIVEWNNITFSTTRFNAERENAENFIDISATEPSPPPDT